MPSKVCVYCIAKNESKFVDTFMDSVKDADLVVVGDTGSTDNTIELLRARGAIVHSIAVNPWRFDVARNKVIDLIPDGYDCLFSIDLDETIVTPGWKAIVTEAWQDGVNRLNYNYVWSLLPNGTPDKHYTYDKIHSRDYRWVCPCHEVLKIADGKQEAMKLIDIEVVHRPDPTKSRGSYLPLLKLAYEEQPRDTRMTHYYGRELYYKGQWEEARKVLVQHIAITGTWYSERAASCRMVAECLIKLGRKQEAEGMYRMGVKICPDEREPHIALAKWYQAQNNHEPAYQEAKFALTITNRKNHYLEDRYAWEEGPYDIASTSAYYIGKQQESRELVECAFKLNPSDPRIAKNRSIVMTYTATNNQPVVTPVTSNSATGLMEIFADRLRKHIGLATQPPKCGGRGVVIPVGGIYTISGYVTVRALRDTGCRLPVEVWYSGDELSKADQAKFEAIPGVVCCNLEDYGFSSSQRFGWAIKPIAIMNSSFADILFLDADIFTLVDPTSLFDGADYTGTGAVFRADGASDEKFGAVLADLWKILGIPILQGNKLPIIDSGVMLINKVKSWPALLAARFMNDNAPVFYNYCYGDKDTFPTAFMLAKIPFARHVATETVHAGNRLFFRHKDKNGTVLFQHRLIPKFDKNPIEHLDGFQGEDKAAYFINEFLSGALAPQPISPTVEDKDMPLLAVVTRVRNRHQHALQSIPLWLKYLDKDDELIIVDYSDQEGTADWCQSLGDPRIKIIVVPERTLFHRSHAFNVGIKATQRNTVVLSDIDQCPTAQLVGACRRVPTGSFGVMPWYPADPIKRSLAGFFVVSRAALLEIRGAEEALTGYSYDDVSIRNSLVFSGLKMYSMPFEPQPIPHGDTLRLAGTSNLDLKTAEQQNEQIMGILRTRHPYQNNVGRDWGIGGIWKDPVTGPVVKRFAPTARNKLVVGYWDAPWDDPVRATLHKQGIESVQRFGPIMLPITRPMLKRSSKQEFGLESDMPFIMDLIDIAVAHSQDDNYLCGYVNSDCIWPAATHRYLQETNFDAVVLRVVGASAATTILDVDNETISAPYTGHVGWDGFFFRPSAWRKIRPVVSAHSVIGDPHFDILLAAQIRKELPNFKIIRALVHPQHPQKWNGFSAGALHNKRITASLERGLELAEIWAEETWELPWVPRTPEAITAIMTSCGRIDLLRQTLNSLRTTASSLSRVLILDDSGNKEQQLAMKQEFGAIAEFIFPEKKLGQAAARDLLQSKVTTPYAFICEDDWLFLAPGYLEASLEILKEQPSVMIVRLCEYDADHKGKTHVTGHGTPYYDNVPTKCDNGGYWQGYTTQCNLQRTGDFATHLGRYTDYPSEYELDAAFGRTGLRSVYLTRDYIQHIGAGRSIYDPITNQHHTWVNDQYIDRPTGVNNSSTGQITVI